MNNWHAFGTLARLLTRLQVIMRNWHNFDTLARGHIDHSGMRVSKLLATHQVHGFNHSKTIEVVEINMSATYRKITQASISDEKKKKKKKNLFILFVIFKFLK